MERFNLTVDNQSPMGIRFHVSEGKWIVAFGTVVNGRAVLDEGTAKVTEIEVMGFLAGQAVGMTMENEGLSMRDALSKMADKNDPRQI